MMLKRPMLRRPAIFSY